MKVISKAIVTGKSVSYADYTPEDAAYMIYIRLEKAEYEMIRSAFQFPEDWQDGGKEMISAFARWIKADRIR